MLEQHQHYGPTLMLPFAVPQVAAALTNCHPAPQLQAASAASAAAERQPSTQAAWALGMAFADAAASEVPRLAITG